MRVGQLGARSFPPLHGGLEVVVAEVALGLTRCGHEVTVCAGPSDELTVQTPERLTVVRSRSIRGKYTQTLSQLLGNAAAVRGRPLDVVHLHGVGPGILLLARRTFFGSRPVVLTAHGADWERAKWPAFARVLFRALVVASARRADVLTAVSQSTADQLSSVVRRSVVVVPNGIDVPAEGPGAPSSGPAVLVSRLVPEKRIETALEALIRHQRERGGPGRIVVAGGGANSYAGAYERKLREDFPTVDFLGHVDGSTVQKLLGEASVYVSASSLEGQPLAVLEALARGCPVVLSSIAAHRELAGDWGYYFDPADVGSGVAAIEHALAESGVSRARRQVAWVEQRYDWNVIVERYVDCYGVARTRRAQRAR